MWEAIIDQADAAFRTDSETPPTMTLRGGNAVDSYRSPPAYDAVIDQPTDEYLAAYAFWGTCYLDAVSWRHYLPLLIAYTCRHIADPNTMAPEGLLYSLRPPDHDPPRLATLIAEQKAAIIAFLEALAFDENATYYQADALQILEEWWLPNARYSDPDIER